MKASATVMVTMACLAGCSAPVAQPAPTPEASAQLTRELAGRTAGAPIRCLPRYGSTDVQVIDDWTVLFRQGGTVYVQHPPGGCSGIGSNRNTMVSRIWGNGQVCSGDIQHLVDLSTGIGGGSCVFGPFIPYPRAG